MNGAGNITVQSCHDRKRTLLRKRNLLKILIVAGLGIGPMLYVVMTASWNQDSPTTYDRRQTMFVSNQFSPANGRIPPMDAAAPERTETATFALG